jgi:hypothetical protein
MFIRKANRQIFCPSPFLKGWWGRSSPGLVIFKLLGLAFRGVVSRPKEALINTNEEPVSGGIEINIKNL